jgi:hypothetical protein
MSYVDLIIKYLSGKLSQKESGAFEKELESNAELKAAYEEHSAAFKLIRSQLQKRDQDAFEAKLAEAMTETIPQIPPRKPDWVRWFLPPAIAAVVAVILILFLQQPGNESLLSRFHHPEKDPLVLVYLQETRGVTEPGIIQYRQGNYASAMDLLSDRISVERDNKLIRLYYLLSAIETDRQMEALERMGKETSFPSDLLDQSISWYSALALIKSDRREEALKILQALGKREGPYQSDAIRLEKLLLK